MALEMAISKYGFTANNGYHVIDYVGYHKRLVSPTVNNDEDTGSITVVSYADKDARDAKTEPMKMSNYNFKLETGSDAKDPATQAYTYLKTLDEYKDASDV
tara:strand:- start:433 stop:735 length:303 start_codon:yes stop_codon:yes gene_type:complete